MNRPGVYFLRHDAAKAGDEGEAILPVDRGEHGAESITGFIAGTDDFLVLLLIHKNLRVAIQLVGELGARKLFVQKVQTESPPGEIPQAVRK